MSKNDLKRSKALQAMTECDTLTAAATEAGITMFTSLDTVKVLLDVLEEITVGVSAIEDR